MSNDRSIARRSTRAVWFWPWCISLLGASGCAATYEDALRRDLAAARVEVAEEGATTRAPAPDGSRASYVLYAMARSPALRASYERWRAATLRVSSARRLPEPMITYAFYAAPVQTRLGPQRHRVSLQQTFPWPTRLLAAADAQSARARASQRRFEASALALARRVSEAWWALWWVREARAIQREQRDVLDGLAETTRARLETGGATLAALAQADLSRSRLDDQLRGLDESEASMEAALRGAIGAPDDLALPTALTERETTLVAEPRDALARAVREHPHLRAFALLAAAERAQAGAIEGERFPRFTLGLDWIETGEAAMPMPGSGDDALIASLGVSVPLWQDTYDDLQRSAEAEAAASLADLESAEDEALSELDQTLAAIRDTHRRVGLYEHTLLPQAQAAYESVLGAYAVGRADVTAALATQRELLELALALTRARAEHGAAWARLERVVGRPVSRAVSDEGVSDEAVGDEAESGARDGE